MTRPGQTWEPNANSNVTILTATSHIGSLVCRRLNGNAEFGFREGAYGGGFVKRFNDDWISRQERLIIRW
jgi:hypothetical protein